MRGEDAYGVGDGAEQTSSAMSLAECSSPQLREDVLRSISMDEEPIFGVDQHTVMLAGEVGGGPDDPVELVIRARLDLHRGLHEGSVGSDTVRTQVPGRGRGGAGIAE